ncbi:serine/threonine-protein kinase [Saccharothrix texasensis]|uniref:serine/threonine-protein kinase n=1 Tax=Saccharothrix texasensis TaxID=103734 RepID=UPI001477010B|nr:serine/threonine-protein kinase [Saccharothrix texasensis]
MAGRYELAGTLGIGGMAEVRRGWDTVLRRAVAVKLFDATGDPDAGRRFDNEARTLARLSHPGLVSVYDAGHSDGTAFVVLRLVEGRTLRDRIAEGPLSVPEVRDLGARLAEALAYVHEQGVVHRDVKPSNILLDDDGTPYLADFGLAHLADSTRFTRTNQMVGTAAYLAPEQVRGSEVGPAADVYSFGLVLLECLTGRREYPGGDVESAVARLHRPAVVPDDLPDDLVRLLSLTTSLSVRRRPTAHRCAHVLRDLPDDDPTAVAAVPRPRRQLTALAASAAGLVGALGIAWAVSPGSSPATSAPVESPARAVVQDTGTTTNQPVADLATTTPAAAQPVVEQPVVEERPVAGEQPAGPQARPVAPGQKDGKGKPAGKAGKGKP